MPAAPERTPRNDLPGDVADFTGREPELWRLLARLVRYEEALDHLRGSDGRTPGDRRPQLGGARAERHADALAPAREIGDRQEEARAHDRLARTLGDPVAAWEHRERAVAIYADLDVPATGDFTDAGPPLLH